MAKKLILRSSYLVRRLDLDEEGAGIQAAQKWRGKTSLYGFL